MEKAKREIRYECLRPGQLIEDRKHCPLIFVPVAPLEYHGPHLPLGTDPINATMCAFETCRRMEKGVVLPTIYFGTERERPSWMLKSLGFDANDWIIGMDFPTAPWKSHYYQEQIFALVLSSKIEMLIQHEYKVIIIVNGHGAVNQMETIQRISAHCTHTSNSLVVWGLAFPDDLTIENLAGHADLYETSLILYYQTRYSSDLIVDLKTLPEKNTPLHYKDFSIVDGSGFSKNPSPGKIVKTDPRDANVELGKKIHDDTVKKLIKITEKALKEKEI